MYRKQNNYTAALSLDRYFVFIFLLYIKLIKCEIIDTFINNTSIISIYFCSRDNNFEIGWLETCKSDAASEKRNNNIKNQTHAWNSKFEACAVDQKKIKHLCVEWHWHHISHLITSKRLVFIITTLKKKYGNRI